MLSSHYEYNHKIKLINEVDTAIKHCFLCLMSLYKLEKIKKYLKENLIKELIEFSKTSYASSILFTQKKNSRLQFCINY